MTACKVAFNQHVRTAVWCGALLVCVSLYMQLAVSCCVCCAACLPEPKGACLGKVATGTPDWERIAAEAARTVPGRGEQVADVHTAAATAASNRLYLAAALVMTRSTTGNFSFLQKKFFPQNP